MASVHLPYARVLLLPAIVMAAATGAAVALVTEPARTAVGVCGAVATLLVAAVGTEAVRRGRVLREARAEHDRHRAYLEARIAAHDTETDYFIREVFPTCLDHLHNGNDPDEVMRDLPRLNPSWRELPKYQLELLRKVLKIIDDEENLRDSSQRSFVSIARRVQAIVHQQAKELREMEEDHGRNPEVFDDLLRIDHGTALIGRLADSISVLGGGRPGRQWPKPVALYSVLRGAMSRILEYRRIDLKSIAKINIKGIYVEPVIHAAAELLDNATRYSPPTSKVSVTATEVQTGVAIEIEDAGVSLDEQARARIEGILDRAQRGVDLQEIGANPRLGLAVVGRLCTQFSMQVSLRASAYGGVRAVLVVPSEMITDQPGVGLAHGIGATAVPRPVDALPGPQRAPKKRRPTSPRIPETAAVEDDVPEVTEWTAGGLPQRRSRVKTPLAQRYAEQAEAERAEREAQERGEEYHDIWAAAEPEKKKRPDREPGLWVDAFWEGLKKDLDPGVHPTDFTRNPTAYLHLINEPARTEADDEGDLK
ncbi:ATP-binding protein [Streptomyces sp. NPDC005908]|uniref:ATP-binding protein n=1 Tax=unclassified Streptomyces TaxID=2593676 RepID=UPI0011ADBF3F|nr:ATP-binding protein [Streptomyces sp. T12]TWD19513.1 signal transduction histidine kinase [Streptomyces sp. T12]